MTKLADPENVFCQKVRFSKNNYRKNLRLAITNNFVDLFQSTRLIGSYMVQKSSKTEKIWKDLLGC